MVLNLKKIVSVCLMLLFLAPTPTFALSCAQLPSMDKAYETYDGVIIGQVNKVNFGQENNQITVNVIKSFKGVQSTKLVMSENATWGALNGPSELGQEYVFFLKHRDIGWENPLCSPSTKVADASQELAFLESKEIPLTSSSVILPINPSPMRWAVFGLVAVSIAVVGLGLLRYMNKRNKS
jgi:hypothetical protein